MGVWQRPWLAHYPPEVQAIIDAAAGPSLSGLLERAFREHANFSAAVCMGSRLRYCGLDGLSQSMVR